MGHSPNQIRPHIENLLPYRTLEIMAVTEPVNEFRLLELRLAEGPPLIYQAGQYVTLSGRAGMEEIRRSYSMVSAPILKEPLTIGVKRLQNGAFSRLLFRSKKGSHLTTSGTGGFFILPQVIKPRQQIFFFAAGVGITPVFALIKTALALYSDLYVVLVYSNHSRRETIFWRELSDLERKCSNFRIEFLFSDNPDLRMARLSTESVFRLLGQYHANTAAALFYVCGPEAYMRMCLFSLREAGVDDGQVRRENFIVRKKNLSYQPPPDSREHEVIIDRNGTWTPLRVQFPDSILQVARRAGIMLPYSCQTGICGNCVIKCVAGSVWMSNNEVLTESDLKEGLVLTCTGHPVFGDVLLKVSE